MKKIMSMILILMIITTGVFADAVPTLISALPFGLEQSGSEFTIFLDENPTTGYTWTYEFDKTHVEFVSDDYVSNSELLGAAGKHSYTFKVLKDGVSSIDFDLNRSFEADSSTEKVAVLVYKSGDKVIIEENQIITLDDLIVSESVLDVYVMDKKIELDTQPQVIEGVHMMPLAETLRALGYTVKWDGETESVEINKGAQWTSIKIGENAYFKNKMAPAPLSAAPTIVNGRTMVPVEFFYDILNIGIMLDKEKVTFNEFEMGTYTGFVKEIVDYNGTKSMHIVFDKLNEMTDIVIHTSVDSTYFQKNVKVGDEIKVLTSMATTRSMPPQTAGYIIY